MTLREQLEQLLTPVLNDLNTELVDIEIKGKRTEPTIKVFVDAEGGVDLGRCESISRRLAEDMELDETMPDKYRLEVSSPGVDRPLRRIADFARNVNREVTVTYEEDGELRTFRGKIKRTDDERIELQGKTEPKILPISQVRFGKVMLPW